MCTRLCCFVMVPQKQQAILTDLTTKTMVDGPSSCVCLMPWVSVTFISQIQLKLNEYAKIVCSQDPSNNRYEFGPKLIHLRGPFESIMEAGDCPLLDQDDYMVITGSDGVKRNVRGPCVFFPTIGEVWTETHNSIQVPVNCYAVVNDANNPQRPVHHLRGPVKFFPEPFQTIVKWGGKDFQPCIEVTQQEAVHLQRSDGTVIMLDIPQFYMPEVGEQVLKRERKTVLLSSDFCILKGADGTVQVMTGQNESERAFFLKPFQTLMHFEQDGEHKSTLSILPNFFAHEFDVRTSDNVLLKLEIVISYQIQDAHQFAASPVDFYPLMKNYVQNDLLDKFSQTALRKFMSIFSKIAQGSIESCSQYFMQFGIAILDIQVMNFTCVNKETQRLLDKDIHTNANKQNELRATQNDVQIQEQINEVQRKQKDLQVQMAQKDNEVALAKKSLENAIRLKEMEIEIQEQHKRTELLEVRRGNDLVEAEFVGRARGHEFREFLNGVDEKLTTAQKLIIWNRQVELEQAKILYTKVNSITMYPPNSDLKMFNFAGKDVNLSENRDAVQAGLLAGIGATVQSIKSK